MEGCARVAGFDMDSTLINIECVDEIADAAGRKAEVAAITEAAMQGVITDYKESLRQRVALLAGLPEGALDTVYEQRLRLNPGVEELIGACKAAGLRCSYKGLDYFGASRTAPSKRIVSPFK